MEIIVHTPGTPEGQTELQRLAARVHMQQIAALLHAHPGSHKQKMQLFDAIAAILTAQKR